MHTPTVNDMKRILTLSCAAALVAVLLSACSPKPARSVSFEILATNDVHGRWFDQSYVDDGVRNSLLSVNWYVDSVRTAVGEEHVLLIDSGDCLQGDNAPYYYNFVDTESPHLFPRLMAYMGYDAVTVGNHDIETGHPVYDRVLLEMEAAGIPFLAGNAVNEDDGKPYFPAYTIKEKDGVRFAILGYTNANMKAWLDESIWAGIDFKSLIPLVQEDVDRIRQTEKPDVVIVSVHSGTGEGDGSILESQGLDLFQTLKGVDFLLCSHDHRQFIADGEGICLLNSGSHARNIAHGTITLDFDKDGKIIGRHISSDLIPVKAEKADSVMRETFRSEYESVKAFTTRPVGYLSETMRTRDAYAGRSLYTDFVQLVTLLSAKPYGADLSFAAPLTFNGTVNAGTLLYNDLFTIYPFENQLFVLEMTGEEILRYLEYDYNLWIQAPEEGVSTEGSDYIPLLRMRPRDDDRTGAKGWSFVFRSYNFDSAAGINYTVDVTKPYGSRVTIAGFADGRPFDLSKTYRVGMTSYRANGGGDLLVNGAGIPSSELSARTVARLPEIRELIYQFLQKESTISPALIRRYARLLGTWSFVPATIAQPALERDLSLLFP